MEQYKENYNSGVLNKVNEPEMFDVIFLNDDFTPMDFVIDILRKVFFFESTIATTIMLSVHKKGFWVVGTYSLDIAQSKQQKAINMAQDAGFPLRIKLQPHK